METKRLVYYLAVPLVFQVSELMSSSGQAPGISFPCSVLLPKATGTDPYVFPVLQLDQRLVNLLLLLDMLLSMLLGILLMLYS